MHVAGREFTKNTVVSVSVGTICTLVVLIWSSLGIGRPLFASDLKDIENSIDAVLAQHSDIIESSQLAQTNTTIQILTIRKEALQSDLRVAERYVRNDPSADWAQDDVAEIKGDIEEIDDKIECYRTEGCQVEADL